MQKILEDFLITENSLIDAIERYFVKYGFLTKRKAKYTAQGIDLELIKNEVTLYIEAKGSVMNKYDSNKNIGPMSKRSIRNNVRNQITKLMEREEDKKYLDDALYIAAWPETPLYREQIDRKTKALNRLGYLHFWVQKDLSIKIEGPEDKRERLINLLEDNDVLI